jgi:hypothetical protein
LCNGSLEHINKLKYADSMNDYHYDIVKSAKLTSISLRKCPYVYVIVYLFHCCSMKLIDYDVYIRAFYMFYFR